MLSGLKRARVVFHSTLAVRDDILEHKLLPAGRLVHAPYGVAAEFQPEKREEDAQLAVRRPFVLHVGSLIARKNPKFLLRLLIELCQARPELEVVQAGGTWNEAQRAELERAGIAGRVHHFAQLGRRELALYYRARARSCCRVWPRASACRDRGPRVRRTGGGECTPCWFKSGPRRARVPTDALDAWREAVFALIDGRGPRARDSPRGSEAVHLGGARAHDRGYLRRSRR